MSTSPTSSVNQITVPLEKLTLLDTTTPVSATVAVALSTFDSAAKENANAGCATAQQLIVKLRVIIPEENSKVDSSELTKITTEISKCQQEVNDCVKAIITYGEKALSFFKDSQNKEALQKEYSVFTSVYEVNLRQAKQAQEMIEICCKPLANLSLEKLKKERDHIQNLLKPATENVRKVEAALLVFQGNSPVKKPEQTHIVVRRDSITLVITNSSQCS